MALAQAVSPPTLTPLEAQALGLPERYAP